MKKGLFFAAGLCLSLAAYSADYPYMAFTNTDGTTQTIAVDGLEMTVSDGNLVAINTEGTSLSIPLESLASMKFTDQTSAVGQLSADLDSSVTLYTIDGVAAGRFGSLREASGSVAPGIYIVKDSNGKTAKVTVSK